MTEREDLDQRLREKLRAAAELDVPPSRPSAQLSALGEALAREQVRARRQKTWGAVGALGLAAAAALALIVWPHAPVETARAPVDAGPACALPTALAIATGADDKQRLALGSFGELVATPDARLTIERAEPCLLELKLEHGVLAGDLSHLKPAILRVRTEHGAVVVRGTRFSVRADDSLEVVLLSGRVEIEEEETRMLEPQHVFRRAGKRRELSATRPEETRAVAELLSHTSYRAPEPAVVAAPEPSDPARPRTSASASELLARAERERRDGKLDAARALYGQASALADDDAEVALLRWVRLELAEKRVSKASELLKRHRQRFAQGKLRAEAAFLRVIVLRDAGETAKARSAAQAFIAAFPDAPQVASARELLEKP